MIVRERERSWYQTKIIKENKSHRNLFVGSFRFAVAARVRCGGRASRKRANVTNDGGVVRVGKL